MGAAPAEHPQAGLSKSEKSESREYGVYPGVSDDPE
jgi:hypothetical protein